MPPSPELHEISGDIGTVEILREIHPEHTRRSCGDITVAGEIAIKLQGKEHRRKVASQGLCLP